MKSMWFMCLSVIFLFSYNEASSVEFVNANNLFAASLYKEILSKNEPNFMLSPFSAETVMAFAQSGAKGETAQEMRNTLKLPDNKESVENAIKQSLPLLNGNESYTLRSVNKMYIKNGFQINEEFEKVAVEVYQAGIEQINFGQNVEAAKTMNEWVEKQTNNKIRNLIDKNDLDEFTRTVLINALYFKGNWSNRFNNYITKKENFYKTLDEVTTVDTMHHHEEQFNYYENSELNAKFLELPFEGGDDISMTIVLPNEKEGLTSLERQIEKVFAPQKFTSEVVNVALPKFKITSKFSLKEALKNLGVHKAFNETEADLSGIAGKRGDLVISQVVQQTFIDVQEDGVEATAATFAGFALLSSPIIPTTKPKEFKADHPFVFYIKAKNFIMFAGRVSAPDY